APRPERDGIDMPPSAAAKVAHVAKFGGAGLTGVGVLDALLEPAGVLGGGIGCLTNAGEAVSVFGRVLQPFRDLAATLTGNWPLILIIAGVALFLAGRRAFRDE